jgi:inhibitor of cysteine peptidase
VRKGRLLSPFFVTEACIVIMISVMMTAKLQGTLALLLCLSGLGCRGGGTTHAMLRVDQKSNNTETVLVVGQALEIALSENPTTGFKWELKAGGEPACIPRGHSFDASPAGIGRSGTRRWRFDAARTGTGSIELVYRRAWEQDKPPAQVFRLTIRVEK